MDYFSYKKIYTYGDMFSLSGENYTGYIQYDGQQVTTVDTSQVLDPIATFNTDLFTSRYFRDRNISDEAIVLPRTKSQCLFGLNETLNYEIIKFKLDCLRENNTYFYSRLFIASNNLPFADEISYGGLEARDDKDFVVYSVERDLPIVNDTIVFDSSYFYPELGLVHHTAIQSTSGDKFTLFNVTSTSFVSITGCDSSLGVVEISEFYESLSTGPVNEPLLFDELLDEGGTGLDMATNTTAD